MSVDMNISKYPMIWVPGRVILSKSRHMANCVDNVQPGKNKCWKRPQVFTDTGITEAQKNQIISNIKRQWGLPPINRLVNIQFLFYISEYPDTRNIDLSNCYQWIEDIIQEPQWKTNRITKIPYYKSGGGGIIQNDNLIHGHQGSDFRYLCPECLWGKTGSRKKNTNKIQRCPKKAKRGSFKAIPCPYEGTKLIITDYILNRIDEDESLSVFSKCQK